MNGKYVAKWILLPKRFRLSYRTPPVPLLVFAVQRDEDRELAGKIIHPRKHQRDQNSIAIILEHHSVNNVKKFRLWRTNSGCMQYAQMLSNHCNSRKLVSAIFSRLFWNTTCLECKQCTLELDIMYYSAMANCLNYPAYIPKPYIPTLCHIKLACRTPRLGRIFFFGRTLDIVY